MDCHDSNQRAHLLVITRLFALYALACSSILAEDLHPCRRANDIAASII